MTPTTEQHILDELRKVSANQELMHQKLFGEVDEETEHGRIPRIERKQLADHDRLTKLEKIAANSVLIAGGITFVLVAVIEGAIRWLFGKAAH